MLIILLDQRGEMFSLLARKAGFKRNGWKHLVSTEKHQKMTNNKSIKT